MERAVLGQLVHDVRRQIVHHEIGGALAQIEAAHRVVGDDFHDRAGVARRTFPEAIER